MTKDIVKRLELFRNDASLVMTAKEVQDHISILQTQDNEISALKQALKEAYEGLVLQSWQSNKCYNCDEWSDFNLPVAHDKNCIVLKAQKYLQEDNR